MIKFLFLLQFLEAYAVDGIILLQRRQRNHRYIFARFTESNFILQPYKVLDGLRQFVRCVDDMNRVDEIFRQIVVKDKIRQSLVVGTRGRRKRTFGNVRNNL